MEQEFVTQQPKASVSIQSLFGALPERKPKRQQFIDEAFVKVNELRGKYPHTPVGRIGMMIGVMCPKEASESFIHDIQKECQIAKNYRARFWQFYNEAK